MKGYVLVLMITVQSYVMDLGTWRLEYWLVWGSWGHLPRTALYQSVTICLSVFKLRCLCVRLVVLESHQCSSLGMQLSRLNSCLASIREALGLVPGTTYSQAWWHSPERWRQESKASLAPGDPISNQPSRRSW